MKLFLAGYTGGFGRVDGERVACEFMRDNGFYDLLIESLPPVVKCLVIASDPGEISYEYNDTTASLLREGFLYDSVIASCVDVCDNRNAKRITERIGDYNVFFLAGGHVPTQNRFFEKIGLKQRLAGFAGVVIGRSAGAMNCADVVYAPPELEGEACDPNYKKYLNGLGLTDINILPHFEYLNGSSLDGLDLIREICLPDSKIKPFIAITDKSFVHIENGRSTLYGEAYLFKDGFFNKICEDGKNIIL